MKISMIAAMAQDRVIGRDNKMPWHLPADLKFFKKMTMGKPVIMGRKTFQSIGRPLPGRQNIVISSDVNFNAEGIEVVHDTEAALNSAGDVEEVVIIGGGTVYQQFLSLVDELYLTHIDIHVDGDAYFPDYTAVGRWEKMWQQTHKKADGEPYDYQFVHLVRVT